MYLHCLFLTIVASSRSATHVLESRIDFNFSTASDGANQSNCSQALTHDISIPREGKAMAKNGSWSKSLMLFTSRLNNLFSFLLDIGDGPKTTPCTFYSLVGLPRVIALKVEASSAGGAFHVCPFSRNV